MAFYPLALVPLGSLVWVALNWPGSDVAGQAAAGSDVAGQAAPGPGRGTSVNIEWLPELSMNITLRFDALAAIMSVLVLGIGALVLFYCADYFHHHDGHTEKRLPSFAAELVAFSGAMFGLVVSDNMLVLYVFWELTTVLSFLLVGHYAERATSRRAATQALLVTTFGGLAMLVGIVVLGNVSGTYLLSELIAAPPTGVAASIGVVLVLIGALSKSAIVPMHFWLPGAMAAPTPVSAYLHAAAMVKAGVYLVARMSPGFADAPPWRPTVVILGVLTMLLAGWRAVREYDLKLILAFGTVSQLGLITVMVGAGGGDLMLAGLAMLCAHAMFKASLFMVVGVIDHATGTRDIRRLAWLGQRSRPLLIIAVGATASMAALPPFLGFVAKEADFETVAHAPSLGAAAPYVLAGIVLGSVFTTIYSLRFLLGAFGRKGLPGPSKRVAEMHRPETTFLIPPAILAAAGLVFGVWPAGLDDVLDTYADTVPGGENYHLALWHGFGAAAAVVGAGPRLSARRRTSAAHGCAGCVPSANRSATPTASTTPRCEASTSLSVRLTAFTQRGSIPATQSVILSTLVLVPVIVLALGARDRPDFALWDSPLQVVVGLLILAAALGATMMRNRLAAVLLVGVTGYGCGTIFAFHGAPDLALTQFLVETLTLVIFVLVLRTLPAEADRANIRRNRLPRAALALAVGATVTTLAVFAMAARTGTPIAELLPDAAYYRGHGANTVNVLLVDIRAWDTMGEISVLLVAATGVASLVFRHRRFGAAPRVADAGQPDIGRLTAIAEQQPGRRRHNLAARQRAARPAAPLAGAGGRDSNHLPAHHGAVGVLLLRRAQHSRRRVRGWADRRAGAGAALPGRRPLRTGRDAAAGCRQDPRRRSGSVGGHRGRLASGGCTRVVVGVDSGRRAGARHRQVRHRVVLRPGRVPDRRRPRARCAAQPRRAGGRGDERATAGGGAMTTYLVPLVLIGGLTSAGVYLLLERN